MWASLRVLLIAARSYSVLTFLPYQSLSSLFFMNTSRRQQSNHRAPKKEVVSCVRLPALPMGPLDPLWYTVVHRRLGFPFEFRMLCMSIVRRSMPPPPMSVRSNLGLGNGTRLQPAVNFCSLEFCTTSLFSHASEFREQKWKDFPSAPDRRKLLVVTRRSTVQ